MRLLDRLHQKWIHQRRAKVLATHFARAIPTGATSVLDVGCGDGRLVYELKALRPALDILGLEVLVRSNTTIPVQVFDGRHLPFEPGDFDVVMFADVLHHSDDPEALLREAARVARLAILIKDHLKQGLFAQATLAFMDWIGNKSKGVALPYNYWTPRLWNQTFEELGLRPVIWETKLGLYPPPAHLLFERSLHLLVSLQGRGQVSAPP